VASRAEIALSVSQDARRLAISSRMAASPASGTSPRPARPICVVVGVRFPGRAARHATAMDYTIGTMVIFSVLVVFLALAFSPGASSAGCSPGSWPCSF